MDFLSVENRGAAVQNRRGIPARPQKNDKSKTISNGGFTTYSLNLQKRTNYAG
jgi:hypothetical protein